MAIIKVKKKTKPQNNSLTNWVWRNYCDVMRCIVIWADDKWIQVGDDLDGKHLSTQGAGGFVGTTMGIQVYGENGGKAAFEKVVYKKGD